MSRLLPRYTESRVELERKIARVVFDSGTAPPPTTTRATLPGDTRRLRGIPVVGGVSGTSPGTDPHSETCRRMAQAASRFL